MIILYEPLHRKTNICKCEKKGADQLCKNCTADQRLYIRYTDSAIPLLLKSEIFSVYLISVTIQTGLYRNWSGTQIVGCLIHRLITVLYCSCGSVKFCLVFMMNSLIVDLLENGNISIIYFGVQVKRIRRTVMLT